jgi:Flp pilus assembly protein TadD
MFRASTVALTLAAGVILFCEGAFAQAPAPGASNTLAPTPETGVSTDTSASREAKSFSRRGAEAFQKGDFENARKHFEKVLQLAPGNVSALTNLGLVEYRRKNYAEAEKFLSDATRSAPDNAGAWLILGIARYEAGKVDGALAALAQTVYLAPKDARAHHYLGATLGRKGWYSGAEDEIRRALELAPDYPDAHYNLAMLYLQRVPPAIELARRHYHKAVELGAAPDPGVEKTLSEFKAADGEALR